MEYETFVKSHEHSKRSLEHLTNLLRTRVDSSPAFTLFLGAGASISSGVRAAGSMMEDWRRSRYASATTDLPYETWLREQAWFDQEDEYSQLFELVYDQPSQRRAFIEKEVRKGRPSWGYAYLASMIQEGIFNGIFTTNFDDLANEACFQFGAQLRPLVCAHDSAVTSIRISSERPKIVKLHGDFLYDSIKNTSSELGNLESNMRDKFIEFAREFGMIVTGYSGSDKSVMDVLSVLTRSPSHFRNGVYWCIRRGSTPCSKLRQLLRQDRVYWIEIDGFDEMMATVATGLGVNLPLGVTAPYQVALSRLTHLFETETEFSHPLIRQSRDEVAETHKRVSNLLRTAGLPDTSFFDPRKPLGDMMGYMETFALPLLQGQSAIEAKDYGKAQTALRGLLATATGERRWTAVLRLLDCLLDSGQPRDEIIALLNSEFHQQASSETLARAAYPALFVNDPDLALRYCARALELNPGCPLALVNKALAHLQLDHTSELADATETLTAERMQQSYRAAGFAMRSELQPLTLSLHRAFATGGYSPKDAARDVAFRPYWDLPQFVSILRPFFKAEVVFPRMKQYPMSEPEKRIRDKFLSGVPQVG